MINERAELHQGYFVLFLTRRSRDHVCGISIHFREVSKKQANL